MSLIHNHIYKKCPVKFGFSYRIRVWIIQTSHTRKWRERSTRKLEDDEAYSHFDVWCSHINGMSHNCSQQQYNHAMMMYAHLSWHKLFICTLLDFFYLIKIISNWILTFWSSEQPGASWCSGVHDTAACESICAWSCTTRGTIILYTGVNKGVNTSACGN